jgi:hypothetical protein
MPERGWLVEPAHGILLTHGITLAGHLALVQLCPSKSRAQTETHISPRPGTIGEMDDIYMEILYP